MKLLFVDNSRTIRAAMALALSQAGYAVSTAATAQEAIEMLQSTAFDLAIMDLYMPLMNGYEAAKIIRSLKHPAKDIPIIALTASEDPRDPEIAKNAGMNEFLIKSSDHQVLLDCLKHYQKSLGPF
jgi:CheY-like chemotaxis protein